MSRSFVAAVLIVSGFVARNVDAAEPPMLKKYGDLPLSFQAGRSASLASYVARGQGYMIALSGAGLTIGIQPSKTLPASRISMQFLGGRQSAALAEGLLPGKVNYILGNDPKQWDIGLPTFERVRYRDLYPGVDVVYYGNQQNLEFDLDVRPGAKSDAIHLKFDGVSNITTDNNGAIVLQTPAGDLKLKPPVVYQEIAGKRQSVSGSFKKLNNGELAFSVGSYDHSQHLVIDPTIVYSTFIGGGSSYTSPQAIAVDSSDNAYIAGYTYAADFPTVSAAQAAYQGDSDGFITKLNSTGTALIYSTYIGGSGDDKLYGIAVDGTGAAWVTGASSSTNFPTLSPTQGALGGDYDAVVVKLSAAGALAFSTYLGGPNADAGQGIAVDSTGNAYVTGSASSGFPTTIGVVATTNQGSLDAFAAKYSPTGSLLYSTFLGGVSADYGYGIAADSGGNAYVTGTTESSAFKGAPAGGAQAANAGNSDAFVAKLNPAASALLYFTFLGGSQYDVANQIAVDSGGNAYVAGESSSPNLPITTGVLQPSLNGATNGFAAKLNSAGSAFTYLTYIGGNRTDSLNGLALETSTGNVYLAGATDSNSFPNTNAIQTVLPGTSTSALFETSNSGASWSAFDTGSGLRGTVNALSPDGNSGAAVASTDVGLFKTTNSGGSWTQASSINSVGFARSPANGNTIYAVNGTTVYVSTDAGTTWNATAGSLPQCCSYDIVADPSNVNLVYAFYQNYPQGVVKSTNGGSSWTAVNTGLPSLTIQSMVVGSDSSLYVALQTGGVYKSTNQGTSWTSISSGLPATFAPNTIAISAASASTLYTSDSVNIYVTTNAGTSWALIPTAVPSASVSTIGVSPQSATTIYAASLFTPVVYLSADGGTTWNPASTGLGNATPKQLVFTLASSSQVFALTSITSTAWVAKLNSTGTALTYSTFLGGSGGGYFGTVATNQAQAAFVTGYTYSSDFPITTGAYSATYLGNGQAFITQISDATAACAASVNPGNQLVYGAAQDVDFTVVEPSGCAWTAASNQPWAVVTAGASGSGAGTVSLQVQANTGTASRSASLTIAGKTIALTQAGNACSYSLSYSSAVPVTGGLVPVQLTTGATCDWNVVNDAPSAVAVSGATTPGPGTINLTVAPNPSPAPRSLILYIADNYVSLTQAGTQAIQCAYTVMPPKEALWTGGSAVVTVTTTAGCSWTSTSNVPWATVSGAAGTTGSGSVTFTLATNPGPGPRSGTVTVAGQTVTLTEAPPSTKAGIFRQGFLWVLDVDGIQTTIVPPDLVYAFGGIPGDIPITGDWNGDGHTKIGVYRPSNGLFILDTNGDGVLDAGDSVFNLHIGMQPGDIPVTGDWNGDGRTKVGYFRTGFLWILDTNGDGRFDSGDQVYAFGGIAGDLPVTGDWTGSGTTKIGIFRQGYLWALDANGNGTLDSTDPVFPYGGIPGDLPVTGDWAGTGVTQVGIFRQGFLWALDANGDHVIDTGDYIFAYGGIMGDIPVTGRW